MKNKKLSGLKSIEYDYVELPFKQISAHPSLKKILAMQSNFEYLMTDRKLIDRDFLSVYIALYPFLLVQEQDNYYCINNVRVLQLAKLFDLDEHIFSCCVLKGLGQKDVSTIATADFYLSHLLFSLRTQDAADQLCRAWIEFDDVKNVIAPKIKQLSTLSTALGVDRRTVYLKRKKRSKTSTSPTEVDSTMNESISAPAQSGKHVNIEPIEKVDQPQVISNSYHELPGDPRDK